MDDQTKARLCAAITQGRDLLAEYEDWLYATNGKLHTAAISRYKDGRFVDYLLIEDFDTEAEARARFNELEAWLIVQHLTAPELTGVCP